MTNELYQKQLESLKASLNEVEEGSFEAVMRQFSQETEKLAFICLTIFKEK